MRSRLVLVVLLLGVGLLVLWGLSAGAAWERAGNPPGGPLTRSDAEWQQRLTAEQYRILRRGGTERAWTGAYWDHKAAGVYRCAGCDLPLFDSAAKYDSGTGWPSYFRPVDDEHMSLRAEWRLFGTGAEVRCSRCDGHLGHVFRDGPPPTGLRYCINSASLSFVPE